MLFLLFTVIITLPYLLFLLFFRKQWIKREGSEIICADQTLPFISVIIPARNEEKNIDNCISSILGQSYPQNLFEIIVVDDHSTDATPEIVSAYENHNLSLIILKDYAPKAGLNSYKKFGIETAISLAKGELIVTTDADCEVPPKWLQTIVQFRYVTGSDFIAAPVEIKGPQSKDGFWLKFLKIFQLLDFMTLQGITGAVVKSGFANMCNGANLAYLKTTFYSVDGFAGVDHIASGDDMLLMEKINRLPGAKIGYLQTKEAIVKTEAAVSVKEFLQQRIRWASKSTAYKDARLKAVLLLVFLLNLWVFLLGAASFFSMNALWWFLGTLAVKITAEMYFLFPIARFFNNTKSMKWFIMAQPFHIIYTLVAGTLGNFKTFEWKGRKVK